MAKQNVIEMLRKPMKQKADAPESKPSNSFESAVITECRRLLAEKDSQIETLTRTVDMLTQQGASRGTPTMPHFEFTDFKRDPKTGAITGLTAKPRAN